MLQQLKLFHLFLTYIGYAKRVNTKWFNAALNISFVFFYWQLNVSTLWSESQGLENKKNRKIEKK